jgi:flagellar FliL protein
VADEKKPEEKKEKEADDAKKAAPAKEEKEKKEEKGGKGKEAKEKDAKEEGKEGEAPAEGAEGEAAGGKKKIPKKVLIIAGAGVGAILLIGIIVAVLFMTGVLGGKPDADVHAADAAAKDVMTGAAPKDAHGDGKEGKKKEGGAVFYDLGEMIVNLNTDGKRQTFLKLVVQLELESVEDKLVIDTMRPRIIDNFQTYLRELRVDDLRGSAGLYRLREELLFRVTEAVHPIKIRDVLFQQMLVQ